MQLFVRMDGRTVTVDCEATDTLEQIAREGLRKLGLPTDVPTARIVLIYSGMRVRLDVTAAAYNIGKESTLHLAVQVGGGGIRPDRDVYRPLKEFLLSSVAELSDSEILFIGVGCFDHSHGTASIKRQQCPDSLLTYCTTNRIDLNIILIDPGFAATDSEHPQIYDLVGWVALEEEAHGKIRRYKNTIATANRRCDVWLTVFATAIPEYTSDLRGGGVKLAELELYNLCAAQIVRSGGTVICGNFYGSPTDRSQFFTLGDPAVIRGAGFQYNPRAED